MSFTINDLYGSAPLISLAIFALLTLIIEGIGKDKPALSYWVSLLGLVVSLVLSFLHLDQGTPVFGGMLFQGGFAGYCNLIFLTSAILSAIL